MIGRQDAEVLIDGAHNPAGARALAGYLREVYGRPLPMVVGVMGDKRVDDILVALSTMASHFICTSIGSSRAARPEELASRAAIVAPSVPSEAVADPMAALERAASLGLPVVVAGSLYLAGEIRSRIA